MSVHKIDFKNRPYESPSFVRDVANSDSVVPEVDVGDEVVLYLENDLEKTDIYVRVQALKNDGQLTGIIEKANRLGANGDPRLTKGASIEFLEQNVFRLTKAH